jgi:hypothetical protein
VCMELAWQTCLPCRWCLPRHSVHATRFKLSLTPISTAAPPPPLAGFDVFISHAGPQKPLATELHNMLKHELGLTVFLDKRMSAGDAADDTMLLAARGARVGLALFSRDFAAREWPLRELKIFVDQGSLLPALVPPLPYEDWKKLIQKATLPQASLSERVRKAAQRTVMVTGSSEDMLTWRQRVCCAVVGALVDNARADLPGRKFRRRVKAAADLVRQFSKLTTEDTRELESEAAQIRL